MKKHIILLGLLIVSPITSWSFNHEYIGEMINPQQTSTAWTQDPKMIILVTLSIVVAARILWWTLDAFESSFKSKKKNKDEHEPTQQILTPRASSDDVQQTVARSENHLANMQLMNTIGTTGMALLNQIDAKLGRSHDELVKQIKQMIKEKIAPMEQKLETISSTVNTMQGRLGSIEHKLEQLKATQK